MILFRVSEKYIKEVKNETIRAIIIVSFLLLSLPLFITLDFWYFSIPISMSIIPFWARFRWNVYKQEMINLNYHSLLVNEESLLFQYKNMTSEVDISNLKSIDVNSKKGEIESIRLILADEYQLHLTHYQNMNVLEKKLVCKVAHHMVRHHRWFHKA